MEQNKKEDEAEEWISVRAASKDENERRKATF